MREQVMLLKAEFMYGEASEVLVAEHTILGPRRGKPKVSTSMTFLLYQPDHKHNLDRTNA